MNIALTVRVNHPIFGNGQQQNIIFFADMIKSLGHEPFFIAEQKELNNIVAPQHFEYPILTQEELYFNDLSVDYFISIAWSPSLEYITKLKKRKGPLERVALHYGNRMFCDFDMPIRKNNYLPIEHRGIDQVWTSPHFENSIEYYKAYYNIEEVYVAPYLWSPKFMDLFEEKLNKEGRSAFYNKDKAKNIGIFEPNLTVYKCSTIPALICGGALKHKPEAFNKVIISSVKNYMKSSPFFNYYFKTIAGLNDDILETESRLSTIHALADRCSYIVSHQMHVDLNYLYLEALYLGVPLIHNSVALKDYGYYYPEHEVPKGIKQLLKALAEHDDNLEEYLEKGAEAIQRYSSTNPQVLDTYQKLFK